MCHVRLSRAFRPDFDVWLSTLHTLLSDLTHVIDAPKLGAQMSDVWSWVSLSLSLCAVCVLCVFLFRPIRFQNNLTFPPSF